MRKKILLSLFLFSVLVLSGAYSEVFAQSQCEGKTAGECVLIKAFGPERALAQIDYTFYLKNLYEYLLGLVGILVLGMMVYGGVLYITAAANPSKVGEAKRIITNALYGVLLAAFSYVILYTINPDLTKGFKLTIPGGSAPSATGIICDCGGSNTCSFVCPIGCTPLLGSANTCTVTQAGTGCTAVCGAGFVCDPQSNSCIASSGGTGTCGGGPACPSGYTCMSVAGGQQACVVSGTSMTCSSAGACVVGGGGTSCTDPSQCSSTGLQCSPFSECVTGGGGQSCFNSTDCAGF